MEENVFGLLMLRSSVTLEIRFVWNTVRVSIVVTYTQQLIKLHDVQDRRILSKLTDNCALFQHEYESKMAVQLKGNVKCVF